MNEDDDELDFEKGDYVEAKGTGEQGRIAGPGSKPGFWRVRMEEGGEKEFPGSPWNRCTNPAGGGVTCCPSRSHTFDALTTAYSGFP